MIRVVPNLHSLKKVFGGMSVVVLAGGILAGCDVGNPGELVSEQQQFTVSGPGVSGICWFQTYANVNTSNATLTLDGAPGCAWNSKTQAGDSAMYSSQCTVHQYPVQSYNGVNYPYSARQSNNYPGYYTCQSAPPSMTQRCSPGSCGGSWYLNAQYSIVLPSDFTVNAPTAKSSATTKQCSTTTNGSPTTNQLNCTYIWNSV